MKKLSGNEIGSLDKRFRSNLINGISGFKSANLIATINKEGKSNLALFSSVVHLGANPPLVGFVMRPTHVDRHTYQNILESGIYTINALTFANRERGHQTSAKYPAEISEFEVTGFAEEAEIGLPPYVKESPLSFRCTLRSDMPIEANGTHFIVGEIVEVRYDEDLLGPDGYLDLQKAGVACISGLDGYHECSPPVRYKYARPGEPVEKISS